MSVGRLPWNSSTGGILWEIWGRHKWAMPWHGLALISSISLVFWKEHGAPAKLNDPILLLSSMCFLGTFLHLLASFGYIEADARTVHIGFPARLLLKPVTTTQLALTPMLFGGMAVILSFVIWSECVLQHLIPVPAPMLLWISVALCSFFWWMQALSWSLPMLPGKTVLHLVVASAHVLVGLLPAAPPNPLSPWKWPILLLMLLSAPPAASLGLRLIREGRWVSPLFHVRPRSTPAPSDLPKFSSAFRAQFWLEWQRQGLLLPGVCGGIVVLLIPMIFILQNSLADSWQGGEAELGAIPGLALLMPLFLSGMIANVIAKFDPLDPPGELPLYIAIRPMTSGSLVLAKLAMALASSVVTWGIILGAVVIWTALLGKGILFANISAAIHGPSSVLRALPLLIVPIILTWKNLIAGIAASLTGRRWVLMLFTFVGTSAVMAIGALVLAARLDEHLQQTLLHALPFVILAALFLKITLAIAGLTLSLRHKAISTKSAAVIAAAWFLCSLLVALYTRYFCQTLHRPDLTAWAIAASFLALPLTRLSFAPIALSWNRHR